MAAYQNGDNEALESIYLLMKQPLYSFVFRYTRDEQLSIDLVQDAFMKLQEQKQQFDPAKGKLASYLFQIAYRLMVNKLNRRKKLHSLLPFLIPQPKPDAQSVDRITVRKAVSKLPDIDRAVVLLFYYHDVSQAEIAVILKIPLGTVKSRLHRALKQLKIELEDDFNESQPAR
ncbi:RNA polymerase sigma factor [Planococcus sp. YIM B11945]|uniref:RNA polymerase sigma factor n=1 Tax=Planococcus sp. YIM B11945 TaxID=3435410 RepID=UPI003D7DAC00